jgi:predicted O-linked N-acetylglucosamine transferase (SPINDLY family)
VTSVVPQVLWLLEEPGEARPYLHATAERFGISRDRIIITPKSELDVHIQVVQSARDAA